MDLLHKENLENSNSFGINKRKVNVGFDNIKKLKTFIKPLCDVKNIIEDKINNQPQQVKNDVPAKNIVSTTIKEDFPDDELFFYAEQEDNYEDIIPKSLQLSEKDVSQLVTVFEWLPSKNVTSESMEIAPDFVSEFDMVYEDYVTEECWDIIKGLDSTSLLFDDIEIKVNLQ